jgi:two-component system response regulator (stage 0 sporulation protein F)
MSNILIVDDQPYLRDLFSQELMDEGYGIQDIGDAELVRQQLENLKPDIVLLEPSLHGFEGWDLLHDIKSREPHLPVLIFTAYDNYGNDPRVSQADGYMVKDFVHLDKLKQKIADVLRRETIN